MLSGQGISSLEFIEQIVGHLAWPVSAVVIAAVFHKEFRNALTRTKAVKVAGLEVVLDPKNIPVPEPEIAITVKDIALLHTSFLSASGTERMADGMAYFQFEVIVVGHRQTLDRIKQVTYLLPESWPKDKRTYVISDRSSRFKMKELANGTAIIEAVVEFKDAQTPLKLSRYIDLHESGPRI